MANTRPSTIQTICHSCEICLNVWLLFHYSKIEIDDCSGEIIECGGASQGPPDFYPVQVEDSGNSFIDEIEVKNEENNNTTGG